MVSIARLPGVNYYPELPAGYGPLLSFPPRFIVVHKTDPSGDVGTARQEASYAHTRPRKGATSAHFYTDYREILGSVPLNYQAWAAREHGNMYGWQVEICGRNGTFDTAAGSADRRAAELIALLCGVGKIPAVHLSVASVAAGAHGIIGHDGITKAFPEDHGTHTDPGWTQAEWTTFIGWVHAHLTDTVSQSGDPLLNKLPTLAKGAKGQSVRNAQSLLKAHGIDIGPAGADGVFGSDTAHGVHMFQSRRGIRVDEIIGRDTWTNLLDLQ